MSGNLSQPSAESMSSTFRKEECPDFPDSFPLQGCQGRPSVDHLNAGVQFVYLPRFLLCSFTDAHASFFPECLCLSNSEARCITLALSDVGRGWFNGIFRPLMLSCFLLSLIFIRTKGQLWTLHFSPRFAFPFWTRHSWSTETSSEIRSEFALMMPLYRSSWDKEKPWGWFVPQSSPSVNH